MLATYNKQISLVAIDKGVYCNGPKKLDLVYEQELEEIGWTWSKKVTRGSSTPVMHFHPY